MSKWFCVVAMTALAACGATSTPAPSNTTSAPDPAVADPTPTESGSAVAPLQMCGTRGAAQCPDGQFCNYAPGAMCGAADAPGHCEAPTEMCAQIYQPVCGCDGKTYSNACSASAARTGVNTTGECPKP